MGQSLRVGVGMPANRSSSGTGLSTNEVDQLEVLGRRDLELDLARDGEPEAVRVDLGGVGEQRLVADPEVVRRTAPGW